MLDFQQGFLDLKNPYDVACSEVRAYHLSEQCAPGSSWHSDMSLIRFRHSELSKSSAQPVTKLL